MVEVGFNQQTYLRFHQRLPSELPWYTGEQNHMNIGHDDAAVVYSVIFEFLDDQLQNCLRDHATETSPMTLHDLSRQIENWTSDFLQGISQETRIRYKIKEDTWTEMVYALGYLWSQLQEKGLRMRTLSAFALLDSDTTDYQVTLYRHQKVPQGIQLAKSSTLSIRPLVKPTNELATADPALCQQNPIRDLIRHNTETSIVNDILFFDNILGKSWSACPLLQSRFDPAGNVAHQHWQLVWEKHHHVPSFIYPESRTSEPMIGEYPPLESCRREFEHPEALSVADFTSRKPPYVRAYQERKQNDDKVEELNQKIEKLFEHVQTLQKENIERKEQHQKHVEQVADEAAKHAKEMTWRDGELNALKSTVEIISKDNADIRRRELAYSVRSRIEATDHTIIDRLVHSGNTTAHGPNLEVDLSVCQAQRDKSQDADHRERAEQRRITKVLEQGLKNLYGLEYDELQCIANAEEQNIKLPNHSVLTRFLKVHYWYQQLFEGRIRLRTDSGNISFKTEDRRRERARGLKDGSTLWEDLLAGRQVLGNVARLLLKHDDSCFEPSSTPNTSVRTLVRGLAGKDGLTYPKEEDLKLLHRLVNQQLKHNELVGKFTIVEPADWEPDENDYQPFVNEKRNTKTDVV